jgi:hypothetical protein
MGAKHMRCLAGFGASALLFLFLGTAVPTYAARGQQEQQPRQQEKQQEKNKQQGQRENRQQQPRGQQQRQSAGRASQQGQRQPQRPTGQQPRSQQQRGQPTYRPSPQGQRQPQQRPMGQQPRSQQQRGQPTYRPSPQGQRIQTSEQRGVWQQHRATNWDSQHRTWQQRGGYRGYRIPDDRYRSYFGPSHRFRLYGLPLVMVGGYPRFQYQGYWFSLLDPWPPCWTDTWYQTDDVYVDYYSDGYYLYDPRCPGYRVAVAIYLQ